MNYPELHIKYSTFASESCQACILKEYSFFKAERLLLSCCELKWQVTIL
uniref:Uncharacterized protein n=1 Tax=Arundo donax TaxID=35708 RepID=A0A0A9DR51_ARUDO